MSSQSTTNMFWHLHLKTTSGYCTAIPTMSCSKDCTYFVEWNHSRPHRMTRMRTRIGPEKIDSEWSRVCVRTCMPTVRYKNAKANCRPARVKCMFFASCNDWPTGRTEDAEACRSGSNWTNPSDWYSFRLGFTFARAGRQKVDRTPNSRG